MAGNGPTWPQWALVHLKCPAFLPRRVCPNGRMDEHWQAPVLHFLLTDHLSSTIGGPSRKTECPWLPPAFIWAHTVGVWAMSLACVPDGKGPQFLLWRSNIPWAGWQVHLSQGPALGDHAGNCGKSTSPLPSAKNSVACANILWRKNRWCGPLTSHWRYSLRKNSASRQCSASQMDRPFFLCLLLSSQGLVPLILVLQFKKCVVTKATTKTLHYLGPTNYTFNS